MHIQSSPLSTVPIYEQIKQQIKEQIFDGTLKTGEKLPSIRQLAKELQIGVITAKRAYDDLCEEGLLVSRQGKGIFVAETDREAIKRNSEKAIKQQLSTAVQTAKQYSVSREKFIQLAEETFDEIKEEQ